MTIMCFCMPNKHSKQNKTIKPKNLLKTKQKKQNTHSKQNK